LGSNTEAGTYQPSYDARSTALASGSRLINEQIGMWPALAQHAAPIRHIHVSDRGHFGAARLHAAEYRQDALGYVVDNRWTGLCLVRELLKTQVQWLAPAEVTDMTCHGDNVRVTVTTAGEAKELCARCLVVADGGRSDLGERFGFQVRHQPYGQNALIANVTTANSHQFAAYERFSDSGPMALLPHGSPTRASHQSALVWTLSDSELKEVLAMSNADKCTRLQQRFGWRLGRFTRIGECNHYPLALALVDNPVRSSVALVGNAAHSLHPVAGQGYNLALRDVAVLGEVLARAEKAAIPLGNLEVLAQYEQRQKVDQARTVSFSDKLPALFMNPDPLVGLARDMGLSSLDVFPSAKRELVRQAAGMANVGDAGHV
jgi:2-octaprenyl-6-methoxyphenol hydroxylase